jgi:hypothetical protein
LTSVEAHASIKSIGGLYKMSKFTSVHVDEEHYQLICSFGDGKFTQGLRNICEAVKSDQALQSDLIKALQAVKTKKLESLMQSMSSKWTELTGGEK